MTILKRPDTGRWQARYRGPDGRERSKDFDRKGDAVAWKEEQRRQIRTLGWTDPALSKARVRDVYPAWLDARSIKPKTKADYESLWAICVEPTWGDVRLDKLTTSSIQRWVASMKGPKGKLLSASRRRQAYGVLAAILDTAVQDGRLPRNPARPINTSGRRSGFLPPVTRRSTRRYLTAAELTRLADSAPEYRALILVLGTCGLRWGEAAALRVRDVDPLRGRIHVERSLAEVKGELIFGTPKTHQSREVPVAAFLREPLTACMAGKRRDDLIFTSPEGSPLRSANFRQRTFTPALVTAGLPHMRIHDLRHTAASLAVASGATVKGVQRMLGHADASMTLNVYTDLFDGELEAVADRMDEAFSKAAADSVRTEGVAAAVRLGPIGASRAV